MGFVVGVVGVAGGDLSVSFAAFPFLVTVAQVVAGGGSCWLEGPAVARPFFGTGGLFVLVGCFGMSVLLLLLLPLTGGLSVAKVRWIESTFPIIT